jgi:hypothetical protein
VSGQRVSLAIFAPIPMGLAMFPFGARDVISAGHGRG